MDFKEICLNIDRNSSLAIHNYYQKILSLLFLKNKDPFGRTLIEIDCEKKIDNVLADLYLKWGYNGRLFTEIIEVELGSKKKGIEDKIKKYYGKSDFLSFCFPSQKIPSFLKVIPKIKEISKINIIYIIDSGTVTKNRRKIIDDKNLVVSAHSPFMLMKCPSGDIDCIKQVVAKQRTLFFDTLFQDHFSKK